MDASSRLVLLLLGRLSRGVGDVSLVTMLGRFKISKSRTFGRKDALEKQSTDLENKNRIAVKAHCFIMTVTTIIAHPTIGHDHGTESCI